MHRIADDREQTTTIGDNMALKAVITADEHTKLDEAMRLLYKADGDKFVLNIEGTDQHPDVRNLRGALDGERTSRATKEREIAELKAKLGDLDPEEARKAIARVKELE